MATDQSQHLSDHPSQTLAINLLQNNHPMNVHGHVQNNSPHPSIQPAPMNHHFAGPFPYSQMPPNISNTMQNNPPIPKPTQPIPKKSAIIKTDRPRPHVCLTCTRAFARLEHLKRHERSHTNEKPFQCAACGRCFARRDLVLRHQQKLHAGLIANNPLTIVKTESQTEDKNLPNLPNNQSTTEAETGSRGRSKNFNSNIIEHKNNTDKIKPLPGQDALPPQLPKFKKVVPANKAALKQTSNPASKKQEKAPDYDQNLRMLQENRFMSDIPQISHFDGQNQMPEKLHHFDNYSQDQNNNLEKLHSNTENSSNSASTSPNDSLYNSNPFSPSSTLNSMSRTATNDAPPISLSSSSLNRVDSTGPTPNNIPLKRINSGKSAAAKLAAPPAPTANYENEDLLASFQMFGNKVFKKGAENNNNNDNNNSSNNNSNNNTENDESSHPPPPHHRHASFSAASAISYTLPEEAKTIHEHDFPEAPHQVGFSTPQMSATELAAKALLAGVDVDALGIDWESLENFSLNENNHDAHFFVNSDNTGKTNHFVPHEGATPYNMLYPSMEKSPNTPTEGHTNMFLDAPMLQEYLHVGGAGGGAGFDDSKSFKPLFEKHDVVRQVQKNESNENGEPLQDNWLDEFIKTPFDLNIDINHIGFVDSQDMQHFQPRQKQTDKNSKVLSGRISKVKKEKSRMALTDIPSLFRDRQIDLFQQQMGQSGTSTPNDVKSAFMSQASSMTSGPSQTAQPASSSNMQSPNSLFNAFSMHSSYPANFNFDLFTKDIRNHILSSNHLNDSQFPSIGELNSYIFLYCKEFDNYFPFVHLPLAESSVENIPLLLAVAAIGALYSFHSSNSILLFGVSKYYIHNFLESNKNCRHDDIPLWLIQCLTLNMFLGIFNNDESLNKSIAKQLNSLIYLVKKCSLHMPLEQFVTPPPVLDNNGNNNNTPLILKNNFDYFILAQSRIRTVHTILLISVLFDTLIGAPIVLKSEDIKCGSPCFNEELWKASNYQKWFQLLMSDHVIIDSKFTLIQLSNGESFNELLISLSNHNYMDLVSKKVGLKTLLSLLMNIHQSIYEHRIELDKQSINPNIKAMKWRMNDRLELESLLKYWELLFIKNEGVLIPNQSNLELINKSPVLKLILPLLSFAKIRLCLSVTPILEKVWIKDWEGMNEKLANIESDPEALRESAKHALSIIELWIDLISVFNDAQKTSRKTPIFFLTCTFTAILFLSEYLYAIELLIGTGNNTNDNDSLSIIARKNILTAVDTALFMRVSNVLKKVSTTLTPESANTRTFLEFLKIQANGALDFDNLNEGFSACAINNEKHNGESQADMDRLVKFIKSSRLSSKCLYLGVRILADAPIWPAAVLFAEALKARSMAISKTSENTPGSVSSGG